MPAARAIQIAARRDLLDQHEERERGDPEQVHHAADEEQRHQDPAAAEAVEAVQEPHPERAARAGTEACREETRGRAAVIEAGVLPGRELVEAGEQQDGASEERRRGREHRREQRGRLERPLERGGADAEERPDRHVARDEHERRRDRATLRGGLARDRREEQRHRRGGGHHHAHHHHGPHQEVEQRVAGSSTGGARTRSPPPSHCASARSCDRARATPARSRRRAQPGSRAAVAARARPGLSGRGIAAASTAARSADHAVLVHVQGVELAVRAVERELDRRARARRALADLRDGVLEAFRQPDLRAVLRRRCAG